MWRVGKFGALLAFILVLTATAPKAEEFESYSDEAVAKYLSEHADITRNVLVPMRDGVGLSTNIYLPKNAARPAGAVFVRTPYNVTPMTTAIHFKEGHRIRVEITSSNFPKFVRNLNTSGETVSETNSIIAKNTIHHRRDYPSYLVLLLAK